VRPFRRNQKYYKNVKVSLSYRHKFSLFCSCNCGKVVPDERELGQIQLDKWPSGSGACDYFTFCEINKRKSAMVLLVPVILRDLKRYDF
jgi:hypothetical protein